MSSGAFPTISVILPAYNADRYVGEAIDSILAQTFADFELLIIDDGSTDGTPEILAAYAARDPRVEVIRQSNRGLVPTLNDALRRSRGRYVARMDADDVALPERFARQLIYLEKHPEVALVGCPVILIDASGKCIGGDTYPTSPDVLNTALLERNWIVHSTILTRKDAVLSIGGYRPLFAHAEDYDLWLRMSEVWRVANLPDVLLKYRWHEANVSNVHMIDQQLSALAARLAARCRRSRGVDPTDTWRELAPSLLRYLARGDAANLDLTREAIPVLVRKGVVTGAAEFVLQSIGLATKEGLGYDWHAQRAIVRDCIRFAYQHWARHHAFGTARVLATLLRHYPTMTVKVIRKEIWSKATAVPA